MGHKQPDIDCIAYDRGICYHHNAPKVMFMRPECILINTKDPRIVKQCNLQYPWPKHAYTQKIIWADPPRKP